MTLRNGRWHDVRNGIIMRNTIYAGNKLTKEHVTFTRQFYKSGSLLDAEDSTEPRQIANKSRIRSYARCLGKVREKKSMKSDYSFRIQETMSKSVEN